MKHNVESLPKATVDRRLDASHLGSLGSHMNQGGSYAHASENNLPEIMDQGRSTKRGKDGLLPKSVKGMMGQ